MEGNDGGGREERNLRCDRVFCGQSRTENRDAGLTPMSGHVTYVKIANGTMTEQSGCLFLQYFQSNSLSLVSFCTQENRRLFPCIYAQFWPFPPQPEQGICR